MTIHLSVYRGGKVVALACVDDDMAHLGRYRWQLDGPKGYVRRTTRGPRGAGSSKSARKYGKVVNVALHREVMRLAGHEIAGLHVDHVDGNKLDCRRQALQLVTCSENSLRMHRRVYGRPAKEEKTNDFDCPI